MNTNKRRELADSKYNERRAECEKAVEELQVALDIQTLGELDEWALTNTAIWLKTKIVWNELAMLCLKTNVPLKAQAALQAGDLETFGRLMNASHVSLEHDYEVTGLELDTLVHTAWAQEGVLGARMTGAGFGGCAIALVQKMLLRPLKKLLASTTRK